MLTGAALGTAAFAAIGLLLGGTLRAEIVLAVANLLWFVFAGLGALTLENGMVPTALSLSGDGAWRQPMGVVVIGGLLLSTVLTLVLVPGTFSLALGIEERMGPRLSRWFTTGGKHAKPPAPQAAE